MNQYPSPSGKEQPADSQEIIKSANAAMGRLRDLITDFNGLPRLPYTMDTSNWKRLTREIQTIPGYHNGTRSSSTNYRVYLMYDGAAAEFVAESGDGSTTVSLGDDTDRALVELKDSEGKEIVSDVRPVTDWEVEFANEVLDNLTQQGQYRVWY